MLTGVHILLSYACLWRCDHCFLHCGPECEGAFSFARLDEVLDQAAAVGSVARISFEGGEPFLFYPVLLHGVAGAVKRGFETDVVTNGYWCLDREDATQWLRPLADAGLAALNVSDDAFHHGDADPSPAEAALEAARGLGLGAAAFSIDPPVVREHPEGREKGEPIVGGGVRFRGRAVEKLTEGLPVRDWKTFTECPDEDLASPRRVHVDAAGNVQLCQGISVGNVLEAPLSRIMADYRPLEHPICGPLLRSGPAGLVRERGLDLEGGFVDACHLCYLARRTLRGDCPDVLAPGQAYGE